MLAGVYKSYGDSLSSLWSDETGRFIFRSTMSLKIFFMLSGVIRLDRKKQDLNVDLMINLLQSEIYGISGLKIHKQYTSSKPDMVLKYEFFVLV